MRVNRHALMEFRVLAGFTKTRLAREAGASVGHITDLEHGRRQPSADMLGRIAAALKVPVRALLADPGDGPVPPTVEERVEFLELQVEDLSAKVAARTALLEEIGAELLQRRLTEGG